MRILLSALATLMFAATVSAIEPVRRNVVLLIADDLGRDLGCYGNTTIKTPNIDALAKSGTRFTHAFACVASCSPSRSTLYTGMHTHSNGQYGLAHASHHFHVRSNVQSLPKLLKPAGYRTGIVAKNHVIPKAVFPWDVEVPGNGRQVALMAQQARKFIDECGDKPFLLVMGYTDPHRAAKGFGNAIKGVPDVTYDPKDVIVPYHLPDTPAVREDLADYYRSISRLDYGVGEMMKVIRDTKHDDDTIVIFLSDNGRPFPGGKTTLYDAGVHLPLIIRAPDGKPATSSAMASWIDIAPTILECAGAKQPPAMIGRSLLPLLGKEKAEGWDEVFASHQFHEITMYYPVRMLRTRTHKYLLNLASNLEYPFASDIYGSKSWQSVLKNKLPNLGQRTVDQFLHRPKEELYDLAKDPNELKNLAGDPSYQNVLSDMRRRVRTWQEKTHDPWLVKYVHE